MIAHLFRHSANPSRLTIDLCRRGRSKQCRSRSRILAALEVCPRQVKVLLARPLLEGCRRKPGIFRWGWTVGLLNVFLATGSVVAPRLRPISRLPRPPTPPTQIREILAMRTVDTRKGAVDKLCRREPQMTHAEAVPLVEIRSCVSTSTAELSPRPPTTLPFGI